MLVNAFAGASLRVGTMLFCAIAWYSVGSQVPHGESESIVCVCPMMS